MCFETRQFLVNVSNCDEIFCYLYAKLSEILILKYLIVCF